MGDCFSLPNAAELIQQLYVEIEILKAKNEALHQTVDVLTEETIRLRADRDAAVNASKWISVKERLPEIGTPVLLRTTFKETEPFEEITIGALNSHRAGGKRKGEPFWNWIGYWLNDTVSYFEFFLHRDEICPGNKYVTHWMPLPEEPKEDDG